MRKPAYKSKPGQILILVLLIVVVSLAIGLSVAARNLTNLRISTQTEISQRAFYAAEYGIEDKLYALQQGGTCAGTCVSTFTPTSGGITANVTVTTQNSIQKSVALGDIAQLNLLPTPSCPGAVPCTIRIGWVSNSNASETSNPASLEITEICNSGGFKQTRFYVQGSSSHIGENLPSPTAWYIQPTSLICASTPVSYTYAAQAASGQAYTKYVDIPMLSGAYLMRIRPLYNNTTIFVPTNTNVSLPNQAYQITSTNATDNTNGVTRKIQVSKSTLPQLPAVFDFALYSDGAISK